MDSGTVPAAPSVPDYELLRRIGSGSYGEVWLAQSITGQYRALKLVACRASEHGTAFDREFLGVRKYEPISRSHPNLVPVLHVGVLPDGGFFYVMELADDEGRGQQIDPCSYIPETLERRLRRLKRLPVEECLDIGISLSSALDGLHSHGLIHRDIKLSNIVYVDGVPKLADIGLVCDTGARSFVGTEGYVPPEGPGTRSADLYALGKVLYEICTGKDRLDFPELPADWGSVAEDRRTRCLNEIVLRACAGHPSRRYRTARQMHDQLLMIRRGQSSLADRVLKRAQRVITRCPSAPQRRSDAALAGTQQEKAAKRLPVYFLLDCSASMTGAPIQAARTLVRTTAHWLSDRHHPTSTPIVTTVIAFERIGLQLSPLVPVDELDLNHIGIERLECGGISLFRAALECLGSSVQRELWKAGAPDGDIRPVAVWFTDGGGCDPADCCELAHRVGAMSLAVTIREPGSDRIKQRLGPGTICIGMDKTDFLHEMLDCELQRLAQSPKSIFYPPGYDWSRHLVPL
jgi:hypothetical protein